MSGTRFSHTAEPPYATPVIRPPSPADSLSTKNADDADDEDADLTDEQLAQKCEELLRPKEPQEDEVLLPRPKTELEEKALYARVMQNLRSKVRELEEEELFEAAMRKRLQPAFEQQASLETIDGLMKSMLGPPTQNGRSGRSSAYGGNDTRSSATAFANQSWMFGSSSRPHR